MNRNKALIEARDESIAKSKQMWVWVDGSDDFQFAPEPPRGKHFVGRVIGNDLLQCDGTDYEITDTL